MAKIKTSMTSITSNWKNVFFCGYADLQDIYCYREAQFYNCGVYGWNCDIFVDYSRDIAITTGYRNMRGKRIPDELIKKYSLIAKRIRADWNPKEKSYEDFQMEIDENINNFLDELMGKEPWKIFYHNGKELTGYTINGTFSGEEQATKEMLSMENNISIDEIEVKIEMR